MAFKYQFETILNLKTRMEDMKKGELKLALDRLEKEKEKLIELNKDKEIQYEVVKEKQKNKFTAEDLKLFNNYIDALNKKINYQETMVAKEEKKVNKVREELIKASKEKRMFEKLKEKKLEEYMQEYYAGEQQVVDNIVSFKYNGNGGADDEWWS